MKSQKKSVKDYISQYFVLNISSSDFLIFYFFNFPHGHVIKFRPNYAHFIIKLLSIRL